MKKLNFKALMINHVEKIVFGFFSLIVLFVLASTTWGSYEQTPDGLKQKVKDVRDKIASDANNWPAKEQQIFKIVDYSDKARQLFEPLAPIAMAKYSFSTIPLFHPLYQKNKPRREPTYEPVMWLITKAGLAPLSVAENDPRATSEETTSETPAEGTMASTEEEDETGMIRPPTGGPTGKAAPTAVGKAATGPSGKTASGKNAKNASSPLSPSSLFGDLPGAASSQTPAVAMSQGPVLKARGVRFVAVRGLVPLSKQIRNYENALNCSTTEAQALFEITDFVLERQTATDDVQDPWKDSKWEVVNQETAFEVINECSDTDPNDPVPFSLRDSTITMPLPLRLSSQWGDNATHPKIKAEELKQAEIELQNKALAALDAAMNEAKLAESGKPKKKGFAVAQRDVKGMASQLKDSSAGMGMYSSMMREMPKISNQQGSSMEQNRSMPSMGSSAMGSMGSMRGGTAELDRMVQVKPFLLFRYLDFDVQSGLAYRYRVRLKVSNPNAELTQEEIAGTGADPEIAKGVDRETPWSNISNPSVVDYTQHYFLEQIEREPYREDKVKTNDLKPVAQLMMFDWDTSLGTVIKDFLNIQSIGSFVSGPAGTGPKKETTILNLVEGMIVKKKNHKFASMDVLIDVESDLEMIPEKHPELKLASNVRGATTARLGLPEEAIVATALGEVKLLDSVSDKKEEDRWDKRFTKERAGFREGVPANSTAMMDSEDDEKSGRKKNRRRALLRTPPGGMSSGGMSSMMSNPGNRSMPAMPSMPGMSSMPGGGAGSSIPKSKSR